MILIWNRDFQANSLGDYKLCFMRFINIFGLFLFLAGCRQTEQQKQLLPYYNTPDFTARWLTKPTEIDTVHRLANFSFRDQANQVISDQTLKGKIHVANFFFSFCPSLCPRLMGNLKPVQEVFRNDPNVLMVSYSVTPERDSVPVLQTYASKHGILATKWHLLTGDRQKIYTLARHSYFADENLGAQTGENDFLHTENVLLIDRQLHIRGIYNGTLPLDIQQLIEDIKTLEQESP